MAKHKLSAMFSDLRGKLNGSKFSKGRSAHTLTNKVKGSNPRSASQGIVRSAFRKYTSMWQTLTAAQILAWNSAAQDSAKRNIFGDSYKTTGHKLFVASNVNARLMNKAQLIDAVAMTVPTLPGISNLAMDSVGLTAVISTDTALDADTSLIITATRQLSPGKTNLNGNFRVVKIIPAPLAPSVVSFYTEYVALFGTLIADKKVGVQCYVCDTTGAAKFRAGTQLAKAVA